jgi:hypothetical protein
MVTLMPDDEQEGLPPPSPDAAANRPSDGIPADSAGADDPGTWPDDAEAAGAEDARAASGDAGQSDDDQAREPGGRRASGAAESARPTSADGRTHRRDARDHDAAADSAEQARDRLASAVNNFHGPIFAQGSTFGAGQTAGDGDGQRRRARTGRLTDADVDAALDHYVRPAPFENAVQALLRDRVVVLVGPAGIGKATSAIALLREVTQEPLAVLAPTVKITDLAEREFKSDLGHVVMDWQHDRSAADVTDFTWRTLRDQVTDKSTYLVITTASGRSRDASSVRHIGWERPATRDLLLAYLGGTDLELLVEDLIDEVPHDCGIGPLVALAQRLIAGEEPAQALEEVGNDSADRVQQWFDGKPPPTELLEVIVLAFASGRSERSFETILAGLTKAVTDAGYALDAESVNRKRKRPGPQPLRPVRGGRNREDGLISRETIVVEGAARSVVTFRADSYQYDVLAQVWHNYDGTFWDVIQSWLEGVVTDSAREGIADTHIAVAAGLATLALVDMSEVEESYLYPWAGGRLGWPGQLVATYVLWWMCFDDDLAAVALRVATRWATAGDPVRRWTAATAFSGELGTRYPTEATNRLWHLIVQARDSTEAIFALGQLFATLAAGRQNAGQVLTLLDRRLADVGARRRDLRQQSLILFSTLAVLSVRDARSGLPSITLFLAANPDRRTLVARLWLSVLRHGPLRRRAIAALVDAASAFDNAGESPEEDARALGAAFAESLQPGEHGQLAADLINHQAHAKRKRQDAAKIMRALLAALERLGDDEPGDSE